MAINQYQKIKNEAISLATPEELILMLYDGALKFLNKALIAIEKNDYDACNVNIQKVQDIVRELQTSLKMEYEISHQLYELYDYIYRVSYQANIKKDPERLNELLDIFRSLRDAWKEAMLIYRAGKGK